MKPGLLPVALLGLVAIGGAVAMQTAGRERAYRNLLARGDAALRDGETFGAIEAYSGAVALHPDSMLAHLRRGESYRQRGELEAAARDFRTASGLDPSAPRPLEALGDAYYERKRFNRAIDTYDRRLRLGDQAPRVAYKLALAHYRAGNIDGALAALAGAIRIDSRMPDAHYLLGLCLRDRNRPKEAVEAFERAVTLAPGMIAAREELAALYDALGRYPNQLEQLQVLAALDSSHVQRQVAVGVAHARAGHADAAAVTLANALERAPDEPLVYQELGRVWLDVASARNDPSALRQALEALEHVGAGPSASSEVLTLYGRALALNNELDAAERLLEQATRRYPVDIRSFLALADLAERQNHRDAARAALLDYQSVVGDDADYAARAGRIGTLSLAMNDVQTALTWLRRANAADPGNMNVLVGLADAQLRLGDAAAAQALIDRVADREPENPELRALVQRRAGPPKAKARPPVPPDAPPPTPPEDIPRPPLSQR